MADLLLLSSTSLDGVVVDHGTLPRVAQDALASARFRRTLPRGDVGDFLRAALKHEDSVAVSGDVARAGLLLLDAWLAKAPELVLTISAGGVSYDRATLTANGPRRFEEQVTFVDARPVLVERSPAALSSSSGPWPAVEIQAGLDPIAAMYRVNQPVAMWREGRLVCRGRPSTWSSKARKEVQLKETDVVLELVPVAREPSWRRLLTAVAASPTTTTFVWRAG